MLMRLRMLKLGVGKGRQVIKPLCLQSVVVLYTLQWLQCTRGMCSTEL